MPGLFVFILKIREICGRVVTRVNSLTYTAGWIMGKRVYLVFAAVMCLVLLGGVLTRLNRSPQHPSVPTVPSIPVPIATQAEADKHLGKIGQPYVAHHRTKPDTFWLITEDLAASVPDLYQQKLQAWEQKIRRALDQYAVVNTETAEIARNFTKLRFSVMDRRGHCIQLIFDVKGDLTKRIQEQQEGFKICALPKDRWNPAIFRSPFMYDGTAHEMLLLALDVPDRFFAGVLYKQFGHANRHRPGSPPLKPDPLSNERLDEEVEMIELEDDVLDWAVSGKLNVLYTQIRARSLNSYSVADVLMTVTTEDLFQLDRMFGLENAGMVAVPALIAFFEYGLVFSTIDTQPVPDVDKAAQKRDYVRHRLVRYTSAAKKK